MVWISFLLVIVFFALRPRKIIYNWNWSFFRFRSLGVQQYKYAQHLFRVTYWDKHSGERTRDEILTKHVNSFRKIIFVVFCQKLQNAFTKNHIVHERKLFISSRAPCKEYTKAENHFKNGINKFLLRPFMCFLNAFCFTTFSFLWPAKTWWNIKPKRRFTK